MNLQKNKYISDGKEKETELWRKKKYIHTDHKENTTSNSVFVVYIIAICFGKFQRKNSDKNVQYSNYALDTMYMRSWNREFIAEGTGRILYFSIRKTILRGAATLTPLIDVLVVRFVTRWENVSNKVTTVYTLYYFCFFFPFKFSCVSDLVCCDISGFFYYQIFGIGHKPKLTRNRRG